MTKVDLKDMISDWYQCPLCQEVLYGLMSWASHTTQKHGLDCFTFEKKYGVTKSYYGTDIIENPSRRNNK